jgi:hypothetical protein
MEQINNIHNVQAIDNSSIVNNQGSAINSQKNEINIPQPILPIESFKYFNSKDIFIWGYYLSFCALVLTGISYQGNVLIFIGLLLLCILLFTRYLKIQEITHIYLNYFSHNGNLIPFQIIKNLRIVGNGLHITYNEEKLEKIPELDFEKLPKVIAFTHNDEILKFETIYNKSKASQILFNQN